MLRFDRFSSSFWILFSTPLSDFKHSFSSLFISAASISDSQHNVWFLHSATTSATCRRSLAWGLHLLLEYSSLSAVLSFHSSCLLFASFRVLAWFFLFLPLVSCFALDKSIGACSPSLTSCFSLANFCSLCCIFFRSFLPFQILAHVDFEARILASTWRYSSNDCWRWGWNCFSCSSRGRSSSWTTLSWVREQRKPIEFHSRISCCFRRRGTRWRSCIDCLSCSWIGWTSKRTKLQCEITHSAASRQTKSAFFPLPSLRVSFCLPFPLLFVCFLALSSSQFRPCCFPFPFSFPLSFP